VRKASGCRPWPSRMQVATAFHKPCRGSEGRRRYRQLQLAVAGGRPDERLVHGRLLLLLDAASAAHSVFQLTQGSSRDCILRNLRGWTRAQGDGSGVGGGEGQRANTRGKSSKRRQRKRRSEPGAIEEAIDQVELGLQRPAPAFALRRRNRTACRVPPDVGPRSGRHARDRLAASPHPRAQHKYFLLHLIHPS
jgi:hypothetical protein